MRELLERILCAVLLLSQVVVGSQVPLKYKKPHSVVSEKSLSTYTTTKYAPGFTLRHVFHHGIGDNPKLHLRKDVEPSFQLLSGEQGLRLSAVKRKTTRMSDRRPDVIESYLSYVRKYGAFAVSLDWTDEEIIMPNVTDKQTLISLAKMTADAYVGLPVSNDWIDVGVPFNESGGFGWDTKGVRGHVFVDDLNSTAVIAIKGTSAALFDNDGETVSNDKVNDNLLFSCCCARISYLWTTVCDCYESSYTCSQNCLEDSLYGEDKYYRSLLDIYRNVTSMYPEASVWLTGHSLGGSMSALLGRTYGVPTVAFEAPPERLAAERLHLPFPPVPVEESTVWHFGNTADPIFMGVCNGPSSVCWMGGYAMETQCHSGLECIYDTVQDKKWHVSVSSHRIRAIIDMIDDYNETAPCLPREDCKDCFDWKFV
ncbi:Alpha/Beta hydrolase protein [Dipodascopsis uninucleata]